MKVQRSRNTFSTFLAVICAVTSLVLASGCSRQEPLYSVPTEVYGINFDNYEFQVQEIEYTLNTITRGAKLCRDDFVFLVNNSMVLALGVETDTYGLELVKTYEYEYGMVEEWIEPTGNYKILVTPVDEKRYLLAVLTLSKYMPTGRGVLNGMTEAELDILMGNNVYKTIERSSQVNRIYTYEDFNIIFTLRHNIVRSIQIMYNSYS